MDFIPDKALFSAVVFSRKMISEGTAPGIAHSRAASYYGVDRKDVAHYAAQYAGSIGGKANAHPPRKRRKRTPRAPGDACHNCGCCAYDCTGPACFLDGQWPKMLDAAAFELGCDKWRITNV
jgi:hypothetical protein